MLFPISDITASENTAHRRSLGNFRGFSHFAERFFYGNACAPEQSATVRRRSLCAAISVYSSAFFSSPAKRFHSAFTITTPRIPKRIPSTTDVNTSEGKCRYKYMRENEISTAATSAIIPALRSRRKRTVANSNEAIVCPDGNEKSFGRETSSSTAP